MLASSKLNPLFIHSPRHKVRDDSQIEKRTLNQRFTFTNLLPCSKRQNQKMWYFCIVEITSTNMHAFVTPYFETFGRKATSLLFILVQST